jgi:hypothetical protein
LANAPSLGRPRSRHASLSERRKPWSSPPASGGDTDLAARLVDEQAQRFGECIQVILDRITYPMEAVSVADLVGREESAAH